MEKEKQNIQDSLKEIKKVMEEETSIEKEKGAKKQNKEKSNQDFFLLEKIVTSSNQKDQTFSKNKSIPDIEKKKEIVYKKKNKKNLTHKAKQTSFIKKENRDPIGKVVEKEIKPIIKKWINKNLRAFVKSIVIEEMNLISKATQKRTIK